MNRAERRALAKKGVKVPKEPTYNFNKAEYKKMLESPEIRAMIDAEVNKRVLEADLKYAHDMDAMVLWTLNKWGFGPKRAKQFYRDMFRWHRKLRHHYEVGDTFPERMILKKKGIDVVAWYNEMFDEEGNYKESLEDMLRDLH